MSLIYKHCVCIYTSSFVYKCVCVCVCIVIIFFKNNSIVVPLTFTFFSKMQLSHYVNDTHTGDLIHKIYLTNLNFKAMQYTRIHNFAVFVHII